MLVQTFGEAENDDLAPTQNPGAIIFRRASFQRDVCEPLPPNSLGSKSHRSYLHINSSP